MGFRQGSEIIQALSVLVMIPLVLNSFRKQSKTKYSILQQSAECSLLQILSLLLVLVPLDINALQFVAINLS